MRATIGGIALMLVSVASLPAEVKPSALFSDHMVPPGRSFPNGSVAV